LGLIAHIKAGVIFFRMVSRKLNGIFKKTKTITVPLGQTRTSTARVLGAYNSIDAASFFAHHRQIKAVAHIPDWLVWHVFSGKGRGYQEK
tara:strand:+ start:143 stop:412 length:270 start_codon:yes stop_codon:yes gene_type:complete